VGCSGEKGQGPAFFGVRSARNEVYGQAGSPLGIDILTLLQKGTKTGNSWRNIDLATAGGFNPHDFEE